MRSERDPVKEIPSPLRVPEFRRLLPISITVALGFGMLVPVLPNFARSFGVTLTAVGLVQLVFGLTRFSFGIVGGLVVDRFGERACTMAGLLIVSASSFAIGFAESFPQLVIARGFGGAGSALFIGGLMNRILKIVEPGAMGRATGIFSSSFLVGIAAGPVLGGVVATHFGRAAVFHFYGTALILATAIAFIVMGRRTSGPAAEKKAPLEALRAARPLLRDQRFLVALLATTVGWWTISGPAQIIGSVFAREELGLSDSGVGLGGTMLAVGEMLVLLVAGRAADRYGRRAVLIPSLIATAIATALIGQTGDLALGFYLLMIVLGGGIAAGRVASGGLLADALPREGSGAAVGVNQMAGDLGYLIAPTLLGAIAEGSSYEVAYLAGAVPAALVLFTALRLPRRSEEPAGEPQPEPSTPIG